MVGSERVREFTGWHMLAIIVAFFSVIIGVNLTLAILSARSWTGLVVENSYVASQQFNDKLAASRAHAAAGWQGGLDYDGARVRFTLVDADGAPIAAETVTVALSLPIGVEGDQTVSLSRAEDGTYSAPVALAPGAWNALIVASFAEGPDYEHGARFIAP